jgi:hypothetical protein
MAKILKNRQEFASADRLLAHFSQASDAMLRAMLRAMQQAMQQAMQRAMQ